MKYHNEIRTHLSLEKDAPVSRAVKLAGTILCRPVLGGLHHQYVRIWFTTGTGSFFSVLMALQCKWLLIVPQDKKTKAVQPKGGEVPMRKMPVQGMLQRCRHRQVRMRRERQAHPVRLLLDQQALQPVGRVQPNQLDRPITEPGRASDPAAVSMV
jgi:hypothetical protein